MAKSTNVIRGRCGNLIFYRGKKETLVRGTSLKFNFPDTPAQQAARKRLQAAMRFYQRLKQTPLLEAWRVAAAETTANRYTLFMQANIDVFNEQTLSDPAALQMTLGALPRMNRLEAVRLDDGSALLTWENSLGEEHAGMDDRLCVAALFAGRLYTPQLLETDGARRRDRRARISLGGSEGREAHLYAFFAAQDGSAYSPSCYAHLREEGSL